MGPLPQLPAEIIAKILVMSHELETTCAFRKFVPEWNLCPDEPDRLEARLRVVRFDTYTVRAPGEGDVSTSFRHSCRDCMHIPIMRSPLRCYSIEYNLDREVVKAWSGNTLIEFSQTIGNVGSLHDPEVMDRMLDTFLIRDPDAVRMLPFPDRYVRACSMAYLQPAMGVPPPEVKEEKEKDEEEEDEEENVARPTFLYERMRHLMLNTNPRLWDQSPVEYGIPASFEPIPEGVLSAIRRRVAEEEFAHLFLDWEEMPRLETLFLDVRKFTRHNIGDGVILRAAEALAGKELKLLVIAGLRSYTFYTGPEDLVMRDERRPAGEDEDSKEAWYPGGSAWIRIFRKAVRVGGKLILVDRRVDKIRRVPFKRINH